MPKNGILTFPEDEGRHEDAKTEWWYFNCHVVSNDGGYYGIMVSYTVDNLLYMVISDINRKTCNPTIIRKSNVIYSKQKLDLKYGSNWWKQVEGEPFTYEMHNHYKEIGLDFHLKSLKPPLILGEKGKVPMGKGGYSYWYALTRLDVSGELTLGDEKKSIYGTGWIDRQWGSWDWRGFDKWKWFNIQLDNGIELVVFKIYEPITNKSITSKFYIMYENAQEEVDAFEITDLGYWRSPHTEEKYSMGWEIKAKNIELKVEPVFRKQEVFKGLWEGSSKVAGMMNGERVSGSSYVELYHRKGNPLIKVICYIRVVLRSQGGQK
jgi:predicted secreted hydrolase